MLDPFVHHSGAGSAQGMFLVVSDIEAARTELIAHGADVSEAFHFDGDHRPVPGPDPKLPSYGSYASFSDPDGNRWILQQVTTRLPGRGLSLDVATLTELSEETEQRHGRDEPTAPKHHWSGWYAAYVVARERGRTPDEAANAATLHIEGAEQDDRQFSRVAIALTCAIRNGVKRTEGAGPCRTSRQASRR